VLPFSLLYGGITALRNLFYDKGWLKSKHYSTPVICVGNLSTGGTGKSPMIEFLLGFLKKDYQVSVLSRGYKRKTKGFIEVLSDSTVKDVGDEPFQFKQNFPSVTVAVCEDRQTGIEQLKTKADVILLDDGFQHRRVKASTYVLLTTFDNLYIDDQLLPAGNLRESKKNAKRADLIIVTKCPDRVAYAKLQEIQFRMNLEPHQKIYFSKIGYDENIIGVTEKQSLSYLKNKSFTLVTGIANPKPLVDFLKEKELNFTHKKYSDHHHFTSSEIKQLKEEEIILTTEKDFVRLQAKLGKFAIYYLPIKTIVLKKQEEFLKEYIVAEIENFAN